MSKQAGTRQAASLLFRHKLMLCCIHRTTQQAGSRMISEPCCRLVPMSEGRRESDGTLSCAYHGWRYVHQQQLSSRCQLSRSLRPFWNHGDHEHGGLWCGADHAALFGMICNHELGTSPELAHAQPLLAVDYGSSGSCPEGPSRATASAPLKSQTDCRVPAPILGASLPLEALSLLTPPMILTLADPGFFRLILCHFAGGCGMTRCSAVQVRWGGQVRAHPADHR